MIVILKLAFCLRAIGVKTCGKTTAETPEGKREGRGVSPPAQRCATKSATSPSAHKVSQHGSRGKLPFLCWQRIASLPAVSVTLGHGLRRKSRWFLSNNNSRSEKSSYYRKRSCYVPVLWKTWTSFQAQQLFFRSWRSWNNEVLLIAQMWPFFHLSSP